MTKPIRQIRVEGNIAYVPLTKGYEAIIDAVDAPLVAGHNWSADVRLRASGKIRCVYAVRTGPRAKSPREYFLMHRIILGVGQNEFCDHIDGNGINNQKINLRKATNAQNQFNQRRSSANTSGFKGVCWDKSKMKWKAYIMVGQKNKHLGNFSKIEDAANAYRKASNDMHGEFGRLF